MRKIVISLITMLVAAGAVFAGTSAFFNDTETSEGNILQAGALDLKIDSTAHYAGMVCRLTENGSVWVDENDNPNDNPRPELLGEPCVGTWSLRDLGEGDTFIRLADIKPGDDGENTISWHVFDNDAWGRIRLGNILDQDNGCTEPELEDEPACEADNNGELDEALEFQVWLDEGTIPGFQCADPDLGDEPCEDRGEGDNRHQDREPRFDAEPRITDHGIVVDMWPALRSAWAQQCANQAVSPDGHNDYGLCHGIARDGRLVGSATYYIGFAWNVPESTGNEIQTDSLGADISFEVEQHRNNPTPFED